MATGLLLVEQIQDLGFRGFRFRVLGFRVLGFRVLGSRGLGFTVWGMWLQVDAHVDL